MSKEKKTQPQNPGIAKVWNGESERVPNTFYFRDDETYSEHWNKDEIGQTSFFRHASLMDELIHFLLDLPPKAVRILSAPCSVGCEPYSFVMMALAAELYEHHHSIKVDAVDLSADFMKAARDGLYPLEMMDEVFTPTELKRFHYDASGMMRISDRMKSHVNFLPPQDICEFSNSNDNDKPYDAVLMFNLLCKLDKEQTTKLAKTLVEMSPGKILLNNVMLRSSIDPKTYVSSINWPIMDRALKKAGYSVLDRDFDPVPAGKRSLLKTNKTLHYRNNRTMILGK